MLDQFQQALAALVSSPDLVNQVREDPGVLRDRYALSELEWRRLTALANDPGMECNCMLYRSTRLTPFAINLDKLCKAIGGDLGNVLSEYCIRYPQADAHFLLESYRFCEFIKDRLDRGLISGGAVRPILEREMAALSLRLEASYTD
jgi:hypothetical protein